VQSGIEKLPAFLQGASRILTPEKEADAVP
jgi:hypothetical protein